MKFRFSTLLLSAVCCLLIGPSSVFSNTSLLITSANYFLNGRQSENAGYRVVPAHDVNCDGIVDVLIGSHLKPGGTTHGLAYVTLGSQITSNYRLNASPITLNSTTLSSYIGDVLAARGDLDGDGYADFVLAAPHVVGGVGVYLGKHYGTWASSLVLGDADAIFESSGSILDVTDPFHMISLSGDVNGDGYSDLMIGASKARDTSGQCSLIFGRSAFDELGTNLNLNNPANYYPSINITFIGDTAADYAGFAVCIIPDINGDGYDDILISAYDSVSSTPVGKKVYLIYGRPDWTQSSLNSETHLYSLADADAVFMSPVSGSDGFGQVISGLGDINHDGYGDFAISAPRANSLQGVVYLFFGGESEPFSGTYSSIPTACVTIQGTGITQFGIHALADAGDVNGDGFFDVIAGEYAYDSSKGRAYVFLGKSDWDSTYDTSDADITITGTAQNQRVGQDAANFGDLNFDGTDSFIVGAPGYSSQSGLAAIFDVTSLVTPNLNSGSPQLQFYSDPEYSELITEAQIFDTVYVKLTQTNTYDQEAATVNVIVCTVSSNYAANPAPFRLIQTGVNTNTYCGEMHLVGTRHQSLLRQYAAHKTNTITIRAVDNLQVAGTLTLDNTPPTMAAISIEQVSTGDTDTRMRIDYVLYDNDRDACAFNSGAIQYSIDNGSTWHNATISGTTQNISSCFLGYAHNVLHEPLYWDASTDDVTDAPTCKLRLKPTDDTENALTYFVSDTFIVDNVAPTAPALDQMSTKNAYVITVTGIAEANTYVRIYIADTDGQNKSMAVTADVDSNGNFAAFPVTVSTTRNRITAVCYDRLLLTSSETDPIYVQFDQIQQSWTDNGVHAAISMPLDCVTSDRRLVFTVIPTASVTTPAPQCYEYLAYFTLTMQNTSYNALSTPSVITITLPQAMAVTDFVRVYSWSPQTATWSQQGVTVSQVTATTVTFHTSQLSTFGIVYLKDITEPFLDAIKINGEYADADSLQSNQPPITVTAQDAESGIASWSISVKNMGTDTITRNAASGLLNKELMTLSFTPARLDNGTYEITATVENNSVHSLSKTVRIKIDNSQFLFSILHGPNPFNPDRETLKIGYDISLNADSLRIFVINLKGDQLWSYIADGEALSAGYHQIEWDGRDGFKAVANGLYYAYCIAKSGETTRKVKLKIAVLR